MSPTAGITLSAEVWRLTTQTIVLQPKGKGAVSIRAAGFIGMLLLPASRVLAAFSPVEFP